MTKPPCSQWKVWLGPEIEGTKALGERTLFIRDLCAYSVTEWSRKQPTVSRVWFCAALAHFEPEVVIEATSVFKTVCAEVFAGESVPPQFRELGVQIYWKLDIHGLTKGDHLCVGPAYNDEAFLIGAGVKVNPEQYLQDVKIL